MLKALENQERIFDLRKRGLTYLKIAAEMGMSVRGVTASFHKALAEFKRTVGQDVEEIRATELARLDSIQAKLWPKRGDPRVADTLIRLFHRRSMLLGLDAPAKIAPVMPDGETPTPLFGTAEVVYVFPHNGRDELTPEEKARAIEHQPDKAA